MSVLRKIFGDKPKKAPTITEAIKQLKRTESSLLSEQSELEAKIKKELDTAKKNASTNKKASLVAIKRKKRFEKQLQRIDGALTTLEHQLEVLETANTNNLAAESMQEARKALKATHKNLNVDKVDQILIELAEQKEITADIADAISHPVGFCDDFDEDELEKELEDLDKELEGLIIDKMPKVPQQNIEETSPKRIIKQAQPLMKSS